MNIATATGLLTAAHRTSEADLKRILRDVAQGSAYELFSAVSNGDGFESVWIVGQPTGEIQLLTYDDPRNFPVQDDYHVWS